MHALVWLFASVIAADMSFQQTGLHSRIAAELTLVRFLARVLVTDVAL